MSFEITAEPFQHSFDCEDGETILVAALRNGLLLKYGCGHGGCGTCKVRLVDGDVEEHGSVFALSADDRSQEIILACASVPVERCVIDVEPNGVTEEEFFSGDQSQEYTACVERVDMLTADIAHIHLELVGATMPFTAGQFVNVTVPPSGGVRTFSLANASTDAGRVELIVKLYPDGVFSKFVRESEPGSTLQVRGPYGDLRVRHSHRPVLMIAGGSGLAPLLSMLRDLAAQDFDREVTVFFGARTEADLYLVDEIRAVGAALPKFRFVPVLSQAWEADWRGETGMVTDAIARWQSRLAHDVYLCGPPPMIDAAVPLLTGAGVRPRNIYFDAFTPAAPDATVTAH